MTRTFVGGRFSKVYELLANEHVDFFALLSSGHGPLLGYSASVSETKCASEREREREREKERERKSQRVREKAR